MLGALVVPTTIGSPPPESPSDSSPQPPAASDTDAIAATDRRNRFRLNTRTLLDPPTKVGRPYRSVSAPNLLWNMAT
ncbi:hypothetical protein GCM10023100_65920 [Actinocorallia cavernae]|uniref:Uncharacterized protein n=2 Tax=Actinomycetes TaxID=1760 RepID=A0ABP5ZEZ4_9ACTN